MSHSVSHSVSLYDSHLQLTLMTQTYRELLFVLQKAGNDVTDLNIIIVRPELEAEIMPSGRALRILLNFKKSWGTSKARQQAPRHVTLGS